MDVEDRVPVPTTEEDDVLGPGAASRLVTELRELGLSTYQARVLLALLWVESANSVQLAHLSGVARTSIYQVMNDLTQQGLTERLPSRGPAVWASVDREKVLDLLDAAGVERFSLHRARTRCLRRMLSALLTDDAPPSPWEHSPSVDPQPAKGPRSSGRRRRKPIRRQSTEGASSRSGTPLTGREARVLRQIEALCAPRASGTIEAGMIGSAGACEALAQKGYITIELDSVGPLGGHYYRYRLRDQIRGAVEDS